MLPELIFFETKLGRLARDALFVFLRRCGPGFEVRIDGDSWPRCHQRRRGSRRGGEFDDLLERMRDQDYDFFGPAIGMANPFGYTYFNSFGMNSYGLPDEDERWQALEKRFQN